MASHMLNEATFSPQAAAGHAGGREVSRTMSYGGVIAMSLVLLVLRFAFAVVGWQNTDAASVLGQGGLDCSGSWATSC